MSQTSTGRTVERNYVGDRNDVRVTMPTETRRAFMTTEFWAMLIGVVALIAVGYADDTDSLTEFRTWMLVSIVASAFIVSRGIAKAGSTGIVRRDSDYLRG